MNTAKNHQSEVGKVVTFDNPSAYARSIRATAFVFTDPLSREVHERVRRLSRSDASVLIIGETGTGKELIARELHRLSPRKDKPFVAVNCATLPEHLVESELFGHEKGSFTGAVGDRKGWFETANGGTLFLDEVGDLPLPTQVKILRALQEREINPIGRRAPLTVDVRIVAATNVNLEAAIRAGRFREDLYYRLNVAQLRLPPLRDRPGDVLPLVEHFLGLYRERLEVPRAELSEAARTTLIRYPWPGNIRELENAVHHALLVMRGDVIQPGDLNLTGRILSEDAPANVSTTESTARNPSTKENLQHALETLYRAGGPTVFADIEAHVVRTAFAFSGYNQVRAAELLGVSRNILRHRLKLYKII